MIKKILYALMGILIGGAFYAYLLSDIPTTGAINVTVQKPIVEAYDEDNQKIDVEIEKLKILNENFRPSYDLAGNLVKHPSGYDYVYDEEKNPVGLIDEGREDDVKVSIDYDKDGKIVPHESGHPYVFTSKGVPVGLYVVDVVTYGEVDVSFEESVALLDNSYYVNESDIKKFEDDDTVNFGQENPMWHEVKQEVPVTEDEEKIEIDYGNVDELEISPDETVAYDTNIGDLVIINVSDIESRMRSEGKLPVDSKYYAITSPFGPRRDPFIGDERFHVGLDIADTGIAGRYVYGVLGGKVEIMSYNNSLGNYMVISHGSFNTVYGHLEAFAKDISVGDEIVAGEPIAYVGNTGRSTGPHLHIEFDIKGVKLNPQRFLDLISVQ